MTNHWLQVSWAGAGGPATEPLISWPALAITVVGMAVLCWYAQRMTQSDERLHRLIEEGRRLSEEGSLAPEEPLRD